MIDPNKRVYVYFNLHRKCFSVRQGTRVVEHANRVCLKDVKYLVQPAGRKTVLKEKKKNVHAGLSGYYVKSCLLYTSPSPRDRLLSRMPSSA